jgi:hypothetical protein
MTKSHHKGIPITIYPTNSKLFNAMVLLNSAVDYKGVAKQLSISLNEAYKMMQYLRKEKEI